MSKRIWNEKRLATLRKLAKKGITVAEIANIMGSTYDATATAIKRYGVELVKLQTTPQPQTTITSIKFRKADMGPFIADLGNRLVEEISKKKIVLPKVKLTNKSTSKREEYSVLDIGDIHYGMINEVFDSKSGTSKTTYNPEIFKKELTNLQDAVSQIHGLLSNAYSLKKLYINLLGDIITNDRIFQGQAFHIDGCAGKQIWEIQSYLVNFINNLLKYYEKIEVNCVVGNHGRSTDSYKTDEPVENNFEYHLYRIIKMAFQNDSRIKVVVPTTHEHIVSIGPWKHLILHGDKFRGASKTAIERQVKDLIVNVGNFDSLDMGHYHFCGKTPVGENITVRHNGCWIEKDNYAFRLFKTYSTPEQHFYGCNNRRKKTWGYELDLRW